MKNPLESGQLILLLLFSLLASEISARQEEWVQYVGGRPEYIKLYQADVMRLILSAGSLDSDEVKIKLFDKEMVTKRAEVLVADGKLLHFDISTNSNFNAESPINLARLEIPVHQGVLGLRNLVVHKSNALRINSAMSIDEFNRLVIGQGAEWPDINIYQNANMTVVTSDRFHQLFPMLNGRRFDSLPLSIIESSGALQHQAQNYPDLLIAENIYILYPIPGYIIVSYDREQLLKQIRSGIDVISKSNVLEETFDRYFEKYLATIKPDESTVFVLRNPMISNDQNALVIKMVLRRFFSDKTRVIKIN